MYSEKVVAHSHTENTRVQARSRGGWWAGLSWRVEQSFVGQGKIKRREVSWTFRQSWTIIWGSRRDQEEGGELDSHEELNNHLRVQARSTGGRWAGLSVSCRVGQSFADPGETKRRQWCWTLKRARERSRAGSWSWAQKVGQLFASVVSQQLCYRNCLCDCFTLVAVKQQLVEYTSCFAQARSPLP